VPTRTHARDTRLAPPTADPRIEIWRLACRQPDLPGAVERIAAALAPHLPADYLCVRHVDVERAVIETVATGACHATTLPAARRDSLRASELDALRHWADHRDALLWRRRDAARRGTLALALPPGEAGDAIAGPLVDAGGALLGTLALVAREPRAFDAAHLALAAELLEPLSIALANDHRWHELTRLREALEADRRALLQRLDRHSIADTIVGADSGLRDVMERVKQVAPTDVPVLLLGDTGTGKEVVARAIHAGSRRATAPVVRVNCGALPPGLLDSELFGHEKGSFTGAVAARKGWFERADGGTLFLDEVGELPLDAQVRLLRILQDGTFERVGGVRTLTVDVRIVAATHRDLREMVARGTFREDLWYRLGVFPIRIPPLRERPEDIPALASHFAWRAGKRLGGVPLALSGDDIELLVAYPWPGNVRELASVVERAAILGDGRRLRLAQALGAPPPSSAHGASRDATTDALASESDALLTLDRAMARHIERALDATRGRIEGPSGAAARLGINPHTLRARMRKLGVEWSRFRGASPRATGD
jgi:transcriptional regulator with GAF, ATPase, and Fis domain